MRRLNVLLAFVLVLLVACGGKASANLISQEVSTDLPVSYGENVKLKITAREEPVSWVLTNFASNVSFKTEKIEETGEVSGLKLWPGQELDVTYELSNIAPLAYDLRGSIPGLYRPPAFSSGLSGDSNSITIAWESPSLPGESLSRNSFSSEFRLRIGANERITVVAHIRVKANAPAKQEIGDLKLQSVRLDLSPSP
ncbi:MAG: hypothetical protein Q8P03_00875 [bacterium]|nr:hypothetical protein [bacterium]